MAANQRIPSKVSTGEAGKSGPEVAHAGSEPMVVVSPSERKFLGAHLEANFAAVAGGPKANTSLHSGAPDDSGPAVKMPGGELVGHRAVGNTPGGNSPRRSPGKKTVFNAGTSD